MSWTQRESQVLEEITQWEQRQFSKRGTDFTLTSHKLLNKGIQSFGDEWSKRLLLRLDDILFYLHASLQQGSFDKRAIDNLFAQARIFRSDIYTLEDMRSLSIDQLRFIAKKQLAKQRLTALVQGGITGLGGFLFTLSDLPLMLSINLRTVQLMAMNYGYDMRNPYEMMLVLKLFHAISLPQPLQEKAWEALMDEAGELNEDAIFYEGEEDITSQAWLQQPLKHIAKLMALYFLRRKTIQAIPVLGIAAGVGINYSFASHIAEASHMFYQKRFLLKKNNNEAEIPFPEN